MGRRQPLRSFPFALFPFLLFCKRLLWHIKIPVFIPQATARAAQIAARAARAAAKAAATAAKATAKAVAAIVKAIIAVVKALIVAIAAGGWVAVLIIIVVAVIALILGSAFGIFFSDEAGDGIPISQAVTEISADFQTKIDDKIDELSSGGSYNEVKIVYEGDIDGDSAVCNNWTDVLTVFAVKYIEHSRCSRMPALRKRD